MLYILLNELLLQQSLAVLDGQYQYCLLYTSPATMDSLDKIKEINDAKDDIKDSVNAIYNSSNALLDVMNSMGGGLKSLNGGLKELQSARATIHSYGDSLTGQTDTAIQNLNSLANTTSQMVPHLVTSKNALNDFNKDINKIDKGVSDLKPVLYDLTDSMGEVDSSISHIGYLLNQAKTAEAATAMNDLSDKLILSKKKAQQLQQMIDGSEMCIRDRVRRHRHLHLCLQAVWTSQQMPHIFFL